MYAGLTADCKTDLVNAKQAGHTEYGVWVEEKSGFRRMITVNIDLALAQIAEMEREQKPECPYCASNAFSPEAIGLYDERGSNPYHVFFRSGSRVTKSEQFDFCPKCGKRINSPYTEGETE